MAKVSTKGYKKNSKDKNEPYLQIPSGMITMKEDDGTPLKKGPILGIDNLGNQQLMMPGADYQFPGNSVYEIPMAKMGGAKKVKIHSLPQAQDGLTWTEYLKKRGVTDKEMLALTQAQIDQGYDGLEKQESVNGQYDIKNDVYNNVLAALLQDYNNVYPLSSNGSRSVTKNVMSNWSVSRNYEDLGLTEKEAEDLYRKASIDPALNQKYIDAYFNSKNKYNSQELKDKGDNYRDVPVKWVDAYPKQTLKGIPNTNTEFPGEQRRDAGNMFRMPVLYDDQMLGQQDVPLLGADWMRDYYKMAPGTEGYHDRSSRDDHNNPAIYPKPNYSIEGVEPVISGRPNWGASATINGQQYTVGMPTQNANFDQFPVIPASAMPGPSAENVFVDTPDSAWMQNYKNKMGLYNITQENLARLGQYDPNYRIQSAPITEDDKRVVEYENQYINNPNVGFYQISDEENSRKPCKDCGTLFGSTSSSDANNYYQTYDVQYPSKGILKPKDLERSKEHYTIKESGNPGHSYLWKYTDDGKGGYNQELQGSVFNRDFLNDEQQVQFDSPTGGSWVVDYDPAVHKVYQDQRDVTQTIEGERGWEQRTQNNLNRAQQKIEQEKADRELWEKQQREKQNKKIAQPKDVAIPPGGFAMGGETDHGKVKGKSRTKANNSNYVLNQTFYEDGFIDNNSRRTLKGFITGAPKPGTQGAPAKFQKGGDISVPDLRRVKIHSLPKAQTGGGPKLSSINKKSDASQPYMYLDSKTNTWLRPPENRDQNKMIDWSVNTPAFAYSADSPYNKGISGGKKVSPEEAARNKEYYRQEALKTPEGKEEERKRLMQEFVDHENANKSALQSSFGNLSLDNPATRDAASNYAGYKLGESSPMWATDKLLTGHDEPTTRDFYRPHESTLSFGIPAAAASAVSLGAGAAELQPIVQGFNNLMSKEVTLGNTPMSINSLTKAKGTYDLLTNTAPEAYNSFKTYSQTGNTDDLLKGLENTGKLAIEGFSNFGPAKSTVKQIGKYYGIGQNTNNAYNAQTTDQFAGSSYNAGKGIYNVIKGKKKGGSTNIDTLPKAQKGKEWLDLGYENKIYTYKDNPDFFDSHARLSDNSRYNDWIKQTVYSGKWGYNPVTGESVRLDANQQVDVSPETKTLAKDVRTWTKEEKVAHPASTIKNLPRTEVEQLRKEDAGFDQYVTNAEKEAGKRTAAAQSKAMVNNPAFYAPGVIGALAVAPELLGAELFGTGVTAGNILNPMFIGHGIKNTLDSDSDMRRSWSKAYDNPTGANIFDATLETGLNSLNFLGARALPGDIKAFGKGYQNIATGNSMIPYAWKSPAVGLSQEASADMFKGLLNSGKLTPEENALIIEYQSNSRPFTGRSTSGANILNAEKRTALNNIINKYQLQFPQNSNAIATRRFNFERGNLGADIENGRMNFGDRPTSFSVGVGTEGYSGAPDRLVIPSRHVKNMGNNFLVNPYGKVSDETLGFLEGSAKDFALNAPSLNEAIINERELIGTGLDFKQIGKVKNDIGGFDVIVKPRTTAEAFKAASTRSAAGESGGVTLDKWPQLFGKKTASPVNTPLGPQAELDLANARAKAFSESAFNKLKLQRFRPGETFDVSNQEAMFMDDPRLTKMYNDYYAMEPDNPSTFGEWFIEGHAPNGPSGRYTTHELGDTDDIVAINKVVETTGEPTKNILLDTAHESTHSRSLRLKSTQGERDIAIDAWKPMVDNVQWSTGPADGFNLAAEESFAVQNELRTLLNDFDGSRVYTNNDIPEIQNALQKLASTDHPYLTQGAANQIDMKKLLKSLNVIGLGAATPAIINAVQEKKLGGATKRVKINALPNNWKTT